MVSLENNPGKQSYISLTELQEMIRNQIEQRFPEQVWVTAEVAEFKMQGNGHCYLELVEKEDKEEIISTRVRAIIWSARAGFIIPYFQSATGSTVEAGMQILIKVTVSYHKLYGLSLQISDIDPSYTLGKIALKRNLILERLNKEGVTEMNRELNFPLFPERIAIISSESASGYTDFIKELAGNKQGYRFSVTLFKTAMQGKETSASVCKALDDIFSHSRKFDIVAIVRGGGSQTDLSWFDDYDIAYMITQFPLPVITGIGHEKDLSVTDIVAYRYLKTPTAAARFIIDHTTETEAYLNSLARGISINITTALEERKKEMEKIEKALKPAAEKIVREQRDKYRTIAARIPSMTGGLISRHSAFLAGYRNRLQRSTDRLFAGERRYFGEFSGHLTKALHTIFNLSGEKLRFLDRNIINLSPDVLLSRGYSITRINGKALNSIEKLKEGDRVNTTLHNGNFDSEIFLIED